MKCMNCGFSVETPYCGQCGQEAASGKVTLAEMRRTALRAFSLERGWLHTVVDLSIRPGPMIRAYLDGKRVIYIGPVRYAITLNSLYIVLATLLGPAALGLQSTEGGAEYERNASVFFQQYGTPLLLLAAPLYAEASWLLFRRRGLAFSEHLAVILFVLGHSAIVYAVGGLVAALVPEHLAAIWSAMFVIGVVYYAWVLCGVCAGNAWTAIGGALVVQAVGFAATTVLGIVGFAAYLFLRWFFTGASPI